MSDTSQASNDRQKIPPKGGCANKFSTLPFKHDFYASLRPGRADDAVGQEWERMKLEDAETLALSLIAEHGLIAKGWTFKFDRAKQRFGQCAPRTKTISLSAAIVELNAEHDVRDTIVHEISHALAGAGHGHDAHWRKIAVSLGDDGERCYGPHIARPVRQRVEKWFRWCDSCGGNSYRFVRRSNKTACASCCVKYADGKWDARYMFKWRRVTRLEHKHLLALNAAGGQPRSPA